MIFIPINRALCPIHNIARTQLSKIHACWSSSPESFELFLFPGYSVHRPIFVVEKRWDQKISKAFWKSACAKDRELIEDHWPLTRFDKETVRRHLVVLVTCAFDPILLRWTFPLEDSWLIVKIYQELHIREMRGKRNEVLSPVIPHFICISLVSDPGRSHDMVFDGEVEGSFELF